jgi:hypothetical protein
MQNCWQLWVPFSITALIGTVCFCTVFKERCLNAGPTARGHVI